MFGFLFGAACLFGLVYLLKRERSGCCGSARHRRHGGWGAGSPVDRIIERLGLNSEQTKTVRESVDSLRTRVRQAKDELGQSRKDVAQALGAEYFDPEKLGEVFGRHDTEIDQLRKEFVNTLSRVHECLDAEQRRELAALLADGRWGSKHSGSPYRAWL